MPKKLEDSVISLPNELDIKAAESLAKVVTEALENAKDLNISAANVVNITTPCIQIILSIDKFIEEKEGQLTIADMSDQFIAVFDDLGLGEQLSKWSV